MAGLGPAALTLEQATALGSTALGPLSAHQHSAQQLSAQQRSSWPWWNPRAALGVRR